MFDRSGALLGALYYGLAGLAQLAIELIRAAIRRCRRLVAHALDAFVGVYRTLGRRCRTLADRMRDGKRGLERDFPTAIVCAEHRSGRPR